MSMMEPSAQQRKRRRTPRRVLSLAALGLALYAWALLAPVARAEPSLPATELDAWIGGQMDRSGIPGYALTVVSSNGELLERGRGEAAPGRPVTVDTPFVIGSTSKSFTALAVMQLVDAGTVDLDAPVQRYVPEFTMAEDAASGVTVRHLLQQTSGIPGAAGGPILKSARDGSAEEAVAELRDTALAGPPGGEFRYANAHFVLAGLVVERVSGEPYAQYVQRHIFDPLQMRHSYTSVDEAAADGLADGHRFWFGVPLRSGPTVRPGLLAAGYLISSVSDLGGYLSMYLQDGRGPDGRQVVSPGSLRTMLTPGPEATLGPWADGTRAYYAMGWFVGGPWTEPALVHPGNAPDSSAMIVLLPERGWAVAAVTNATHELPAAPPVVDRLSRNAVDIVVGDKPVAAGSLRAFYAVFDLGALLLLAGAGWSLGRAVRMVRRRARPRRGPSILAIAASLLGAVLLLQLPATVGYGWGAAWVWLPDLTLVVGLLVLILAANAFIRGCALWYWRRRTAPI